MCLDTSLFDVHETTLILSKRVDFLFPISVMMRINDWDILSEDGDRERYSLLTGVRFLTACGTCDRESHEPSAGHSIVVNAFGLYIYLWARSHGSSPFGDDGNREISSSPPFFNYLPLRRDYI